MKKTTITHLFLDIGGVLLTNGWDHNSRKKAALEFNLDWTEVEHRHQLVFAVYEEGKLALDEYLNWVVFYKNRSFTREQFQAFMFAESKPYPEMINLMHSLKEKNSIRELRKFFLSVKGDIVKIAWVESKAKRGIIQTVKVCFLCKMHKI